ncbi:hypothetical protein [Nocardia tengchongensis]|uniref:hypothetical protein n=1 Tax=Nocardia tengchongensis TaxID=2055889 RepID=UPI0036BE5D49
MARLQTTVYVPVVLAVPAIGVLLWGLVIAAVAAVLIAVAVTTAHFSDGSSTVPSTLGSCEPFCGVRTSTVPTPEATR